MSRGRGRGRVRFGGSGDSSLRDLLDDNREDLGLSYNQMESLNAEGSDQLFPPLELPQPEKLTDRFVYLIQKQRALAHKMENLYPPNPPVPDSAQQQHASGANGTSDNGLQTALVHVTVPEDQKPNEVFIPKELQSNTLREMHQINFSLKTKGIMQPKAFENVFKSLEAQEKSKKTAAGAAAGGDQDGEDAMEPEEGEDDLGDDQNDYTYDYYDSDAASDEGDEEVFF